MLVKILLLACAVSTALSLRVAYRSTTHRPGSTTALPRRFCRNVVCPRPGPGCDIALRNLRRPGWVKRRCCKCPVIEPVNPCPQVSCRRPDPCPAGQEVQPTTFTFRGKKCAGCPECKPKPVISCPKPSCRRPATCPPGEESQPFTFQFKGRKCNGCPACRPVRGCPVLTCLAIFKRCPAGFEFVPRAFKQNGEICQGCRDCFRQCPLVRCAHPRCDNPKPTKFISGGRACNGCPKCDETDVCPIVACTKIFKFCPAGQEFVPRARMVNGKICKGCSDCFPICLPLPCARPPCNNPKPTQIIQRGRVCAGCPVCDNNGGVSPY